MSTLDPTDPFAPDVALRATPPLAQFNTAGVLAAADVHVARTLARLGNVDDPDVVLAAALAVRAPRLGHVFVDLETISATATADGDQPEQNLPWPDAERWSGTVAGATGLVGSDDGTGTFPLRLSGTRLYLDRYFRQERRLGGSLRSLAQLRADIGELPRLAAQLQELFPDPEDGLQRVAVATAVMRNLTVIAGGPGTGKTTTIAALVQLLRRRGEPLIALCAPTGKAAARMQEAVGQDVSASTIHKLLGWLPGGRFRYNAASRLPHDVVIVDETSMVSLTLMCKLVEAVRSDAQLVLVGDPDQLAAIEAGAVLRDIVGPAAAAPQFSAGVRSMLELTAKTELPPSAAGRSFGDGVVVLRRGHRFGETIGALADAIKLGHEDLAVSALNGSPDEIQWLPEPDEQLRDQAVASYSAVTEAARAGDGGGALAALTGFRILCAHRHGPAGVQRWNRQVEAWLAESLDDFHPDGPAYIGRPLMVTENDYELQLFNGDTGVVVAGGAPSPDNAGPAGEPILTGTAARDAAETDAQAIFDGAAQGFAPSRLSAVETVYAMTVHKSQGSQFDVTAVVLPQPDSPLLTRELLYTAVTRARRRLILVGGEESVRAAVARPLQRATGLRQLLWQ
jgi:exodeoxyribonuclease V alpha subunit